MKLSNFFRMLFFSLMMLTSSIPAQDLNVYDMIGASRNEVIKKFGKPVHQDNSIPSMVCLFYKTPEFSLTFVIGTEGVTQLEENINYGSEKEAGEVLNKIISGSLEKNYAIDTVSAMAYQITKQGVSADLQIYSDQISKKFTINLKVKRSY